MRLRVSGILERIRASLFLAPMVAVILAAGMAAASIAIDSRLDQSGARLPLGLTAEALTSVDLPDRTAMVTEQARLVVAGCERAAPQPTDLRTVQRAFPNRLRAT